MKKLSEICKITGVTRRTLQEYAKIGLLEPTVEENGYWMYTDDDISLLMGIQMLRMADYTRSEIKEMIRKDSPIPVMSCIKTRLEEKRKRIDGMIEMIDVMQRVQENNYDLAAKKIYPDYSSIVANATTLTHIFERMIDGYSSTSPDISHIVACRAAALASVKELPADSQIVQDRVKALYSAGHELVIILTRDEAAEDPHPAIEAMISYLEEGWSMFAILSDKEVEEYMSEVMCDPYNQELAHNIEKLFGAGSVDYVLNALISYSRDNYPEEEAKDVLMQKIAFIKSKQE